MQLTDDYIEKFKDQWRTASTDGILGDELCASALLKYQARQRLGSLSSHTCSDTLLQCPSDLGT